jgi:leader peptidase (prepilin peptidase)/N-methyltransferase
MSALIVTIRSDIETMLISRYVTIFLVPVAFTLSYFNMMPITFTASLIGALCGYFFLFFINSIFKWLTNKNGIGEGDFDLLCLIGAFTGILGCWASVTIGSALGSIFGLLYMLYIRYFTTKETNSLIPFGPFLASGAIIYIFFMNTFLIFFKFL